MALSPVQVRLLAALDPGRTHSRVVLGSCSLVHASGAGESTFRSLGERGLIERVPGPGFDVFYQITALGRAALATAQMAETVARLP